MLRALGRISFAFVLLLACAGALAIGVFMTAVEVFAPPRYEVVFTEHPNVSAAAWTVFDIETGEVLHAENDRAVLPIASVTKLPVAATLYAGYDLWKETLIVHQIVVTDGRAGSLELGKMYALHTLLFPLLLESSNDAAAAIVRTADDIIANTNVYAGSLGLTNTRFTDASGLSPQNVSTAAELATLIEDIYKSHRHVIDMTHVPYYVFDGQGWRNNSPFANDRAYVGGKHGYTPEAGHTGVLLFNEEFAGDVRTVGYVVLGSDDLAVDIAALRAYVHDHVHYR